LLRLRDEGTVVTVRGLRPEFARLLEVVAQHASDQAARSLRLPPVCADGARKHRRSAATASSQAFALLSFVGENALALPACITRPARCAGVPILFNIRTAGFDALPIVGLLSFLLGIVVAYQGADQLRQVRGQHLRRRSRRLVDAARVRPLITAIIIAGRSGPPMPRRSARCP
jgi:phospholipid/cholesterol/gamma-HCH transport system permease protein